MFDTPDLDFTREVRVVRLPPLAPPPPPPLFAPSPGASGGASGGASDGGDGGALEAAYGTGGGGRWLLGALPAPPAHSAAKGGPAKSGGAAPAGGTAKAGAKAGAASGTRSTRVFESGAVAGEVIVSGA